MRILIVEDDRILAQTIEQILKSKYDIDHAYDGEEGLLYAKQNIYDVIIFILIFNFTTYFETKNILDFKK